MDQLERVSAETDSVRGTEATLGTRRSPAVVARKGAAVHERINHPRQARWTACREMMDQARKECAMRSLYARGVTLAIVLASLASHALAQEASSPSLLALPPVQNNHWVSQTTATDALF